MCIITVFINRRMEQNNTTKQHISCLSRSCVSEVVSVTFEWVVQHARTINKEVGSRRFQPLSLKHDRRPRQGQCQSNMTCQCPVKTYQCHVNTVHVYIIVYSTIYIYIHRERYIERDVYIYIYIYIYVHIIVTIHNIPTHIYIYLYIYIYIYNGAQLRLGGDTSVGQLCESHARFARELALL